MNKTKKVLFIFSFHKCNSIMSTISDCTAIQVLSLDVPLVIFICYLWSAFLSLPSFFLPCDNEIVRCLTGSFSTAKCTTYGNSKMMVYISQCFSKKFKKWNHMWKYSLLHQCGIVNKFQLYLANLLPVVHKSHKRRGGTSCSSGAIVYAQIVSIH